MLVIAHYVDRSPYGLGLFTREALHHGQLVCNDDYRLIHILSLAEIATYPKPMQAHFLRHSYRGVGDDELQGAVYYNTDDTRFINHSDTPNLLYVKEREIYVAACDMPAGMELTCNYADFARRGDDCFNF